MAALKKILMLDMIVITLFLVLYGILADSRLNKADEWKTTNGDKKLSPKSQREFKNCTCYDIHSCCCCEEVSVFFFGLFTRNTCGCVRARLSLNGVLVYGTWSNGRLMKENNVSFVDFTKNEHPSICSGFFPPVLSITSVCYTFEYLRGELNGSGPLFVLETSSQITLFGIKVGSTRFHPVKISPLKIERSGQ